MSSVKQTDPYKALGITPQASPREVKESYLGWIRYFDHPEERPKPGTLQGSLIEQIEQVQEAYNLLSDDEKRGEYNARMNLASASPETEPAEPAKKSSVPRAYGDVEGMIEKRKQARSYLEFLGLSEKPFELTPNPKFFYLSSRHKEVLAQLVLALQENKGIVKITGEVGTGKTTLCRSFLKELHSGIDFAYLFHPCANAMELMQYINAEFGLPSQSRNKKELLFHLKEFLVKKKSEGRGVAVVVDEAQDLAPEILEELRILSNLETETDKLLQIVLIGQPALNKTLGRASMRQLQQRISAQWDLAPLNIEETHGYTQHRLNVAGGKGKVAFSRSAADAVFRYSSGLPRLINGIADQALVVAHQEGVRKIDRRIILQAEKELAELQPQPSKAGWLWKLAAALIVAGGLAAIVIYFQTQFSWSGPAARDHTLPQMIEKTPMNLSQPGRLVPNRPPKTRTLASLGNPAKDSAQAEEAVASPPEDSAQPVSFSEKEALIRELSTLTTGESRIEAARWVLKRWGAFRKETVTLNLKARKILQTDYGLSVYESSGNLNRLTTLNYPALVELKLPGGQGPRYLALVELQGDIGIFKSSGETLEIPLSLFDSLWTRKAWVLWNNFEQLPGSMKAGYQGKKAEWLQQQLSLLGYYKEQPVPRYGTRTADAVAKFQRYYNLKDHGRLDTETKMILYNRLPAYHVPKLTGG